jgi:hypothetical protein
MLLCCGGCADADPVLKATARAKASGFLLASVPTKVQSVIEARADAKDGDEITITGRIGGSTDPWVNGRAAFQIVDNSLIPCNEREHGGCPTPWDYCCLRNRLPAASATIKFVDSNGETLSTDARQLLGAKELLHVTIQGQAKRDSAGNLTVLAQGIHFSR